MEVERPPGCLPFFLFRIRGTVLVKIWGQWLFMILYTTGIVCLHNFVDELRMNFPLYMVTVIGTVTGLLLVFRTNTAYDRFWEGRKLVATLIYHVRSLSLNIWVGMDGTGAKDVDETSEIEDILERTTVLNLLIGFACATKNYLRGDYAYDSDDLRCFIGHLPRFQRSATSDLSPNSPGLKEEGSVKRRGKRAIEGEGDLSENVTVQIPMIDKDEGEKEKSKDLSKGDKKKKKRKILKHYRIKAYDVVTPTNIPIEIVYYIFSYLKTVAARGKCEANVLRNSQSSCLALLDCLTQLERILRTPIPLAYSIHLNYTVWIYLLALPYQFVGNLNWWTIPAVSLASFALLGILAIGGEIENPFGDDENDLPMDDYCNVIREEIQMLVGNPMPPIKTWVMSEDNQPFAPRSWLNSQELATKSGEKLREILTRTRRTRSQQQILDDKDPIDCTNL